MKKAPANTPMTHERLGRMLAGLSLLATLTLATLHSHWWLLGAAGVATNLVISAITDRCVVKSLLIRMGVPGERDIGRAEAALRDVKARPIVFHRRAWNVKAPVN